MFWDNIPKSIDTEGPGGGFLLAASLPPFHVLLSFLRSMYSYEDITQSPEPAGQSSCSSLSSQVLFPPLQQQLHHPQAGLCSGFGRRVRVWFQDGYSSAEWLGSLKQHAVFLLDPHSASSKLLSFQLPVLCACSIPHLSHWQEHNTGQEWIQSPEALHERLSLWTLLFQDGVGGIHM